MKYKNIITAIVLLPFVIYFYPAFFLDNHSSLTCSNKDGNYSDSTNILKEEFGRIKKDSSDLLNPKLTFPSPIIDWLDLHYNSIVVDTHNDFLWQVFKRNADFGKRDAARHSGLIKLIEGGVGVQVFAVWLPAEEKSPLEFAIHQTKRLKEFQKNYFDLFEIASNYKDIERIHSQGKLCGLMGLEGGTPIENNIDNVDILYSAGIRYIGLTWDNSNSIATSAFDEQKKGRAGGLTDFGKEVVKRMNKLGIIVDVSHLGEKSSFDVMEISTQPVIASHSCCKAINNSYRNLTDEQIKAVANTGGVIMINFNKGYLSSNSGGTTAYEKYKIELEQIYNECKNMNEFNIKRFDFLKNKIPENEITVDNIVNHIDYVKNLVGIDYVGLGSDFDGGISPPFDMYDATCFPLLTKKLAERNYTEIEIRKVLGLNFLRVFKQITN